MTATILIFLFNMLSAANMLLLYLLLFAKNFYFDKTKIGIITGVYCVFGAAGAVTYNGLIVSIATWGILLAVNICCCAGNRIYNIFMMFPAFFFYTMMSVFPEYIYRLVTRTQGEKLYDIEGSSAESVLLDIILVLFLAATFAWCKKNQINMRLKALEVTGFCLYFVFTVFIIYSIGVFNATQSLSVSMILDGLAVFFLLVIFVAYWGYLIIRRKNRQLESAANDAKNYIAMQLDFLEREESDQMEMRKLRHDLRNHMQVISEMCSHKEYAQVQKYVSALAGRPELSQRFHITGNQAADIVISHTKEAAEKYHIDFSCEGDYAVLNRFLPTDVCTLLSNILDNALEASGGTEHPAITMKGIEHKNFFSISVSNRVSHPVNIRGNRIVTSKKDKKTHGFGLLNVEDIVKKWHGQMLLKCDAGIFEVQVIIPKK